MRILLILHTCDQVHCKNVTCMRSGCCDIYISQRVWRHCVVAKAVTVAPAALRRSHLTLLGLLRPTPRQVVKGSSLPFWQCLKSAKPSHLASKHKIKTSLPLVGAKRNHSSAKRLTYTPQSFTSCQQVAELLT